MRERINERKKIKIEKKITEKRSYKIKKKKNQKDESTITYNLFLTSLIKDKICEQAKFSVFS